MLKILTCSKDASFCGEANVRSFFAITQVRISYFMLEIQNSKICQLTNFCMFQKYTDFKERFSLTQPRYWAPRSTAGAWLAGIHIHMVLFRIENGADPALHCVGSVQPYFPLGRRCGDFSGEDFSQRVLINTLNTIEMFKIKVHFIYTFLRKTSAW